MKSKTKKLSIALAGIMSAVAIASAVPAGTAGTLGSVATVAHAANLNDKYLSSDAVYNGDSTITNWSTFKVGDEAKCIVVINGNVSVGKECYLSVCKGSTLIINGSVTLGNGAWFTIYDYEAGSRCIVTGTVTNNGGNLPNKGIVYTDLSNIGYVAETENNYAYFTSGGKYYTFNGSTFVETTEAAVSKSKPATATYAQVGTDYEPTSDGDRTASLWKVTVTPGTDAVTELNVEVNGRRAAEALKSDTAFNGNGGIVFGVVLNKGATDVESFKVLVNGVAVD